MSLSNVPDNSPYCGIARARAAPQDRNPRVAGRGTALVHLPVFGGERTEVTMSETNGAASEFEESVARLRESWMALFRVEPNSSAGSRQGLGNEFLQMQQNMLGFATAFAEPMRRFVESQQELSKQVSEWADSQRALAEIAAAWAQSQRKLSDLLTSWVNPATLGQNDD